MLHSLAATHQSALLQQLPRDPGAALARLQAWFLIAHAGLRRHENAPLIQPNQPGHQTLIEFDSTHHPGPERVVLPSPIHARPHPARAKSRELLQQDVPLGKQQGAQRVLHAPSNSLRQVR